MKILYASLRPYFPLRIAHGGQRSIHDLLVESQRMQGVECAAIFRVDNDYLTSYFPSSSEQRILGIRHIRKDKDRIWFECEYPILAVANNQDQYWSYLNDLCNQFQPDVLFTGQGAAHKIVGFAHDRNIPVILNIDTPPGHGVYEISNLVDATGMGAVVICCSNYLHDLITDVTSAVVNPIVVYPPMDKATYHVEKHWPEYLTVINPLPSKGGEIIEQVVRAMPEVKFMCVAGWEMDLEQEYWAEFRSRMNKYVNVTVVPRTADIRTVLSKTKLLLVPSQWDEALGRVVWEAQSNGIPSIVSAIGGLPEILLSGGELVHDYRNAEAWISTLRAILTTNGRLEILCDEARRCSERSDFLPSNSVAQFMKSAETAIKKSYISN